MRGRNLGLEFSMAERQGLEARIQSILSDRPKTEVTRMQIFKTAAIALGAALVLALSRPSFADDGAQASAQPGATPIAENSPVAQNALSAPLQSARPHSRASRHRGRKTDAAGAEHKDVRLATVHVGETVAKAVADAHLDEIVAKALADAQIDKKIAAALEAAQPVIDAAMARAQAQAQQAFPQQQPTPPGGP
jgi:hypothetical protein